MHGRAIISSENTKFGKVWSQVYYLLDSVLKAMSHLWCSRCSNIPLFDCYKFEFQSEFGWLLLLHCIMIQQTFNNMAIYMTKNKTRTVLFIGACLI